MLNSHGGVEADLTVSSIESGQGGVCDPKFEDNQTTSRARPLQLPP